MSWFKKITLLKAVLLMAGTSLHAGVMEHQKVVVIVDGNSTGRYLAPLFRGNGYDVIHVSSELGRALKVPFPAHDYVLENIHHTGSLEAVLERLSHYKVLAVIAGAEPGVNLADELSEALHLPSANGTHKSSARRDKFIMQEILKTEGVSYIRQLKSNNIQEILSWVKQNSIHPVVLKPLASAGTDGVTFCDSINEIESAFKKIIGSTDIFGVKNTEVLVQEMIVGREYMVNSVSSFGKHYIAEIWRMTKNVIHGTPLYDYAELVSPGEGEFEVLNTYVGKVLTALEMNHGAGHSEVMITAEGPILIETAARLGGTNDPSALSEAREMSQASLLVDSYVHPDRFTKVLRKPQPELKKQVLISFLQSSMSGRVHHDLEKKQIFNLPGTHGIYFGPHTGDTLPETSSLINSPGFVVFVGDDLEVLKESHRKLRALEQSLYRQMLEL